MGNRCESAICESRAEAAVSAIWHHIGDGQHYCGCRDAPGAGFEVRHDDDEQSVLVTPENIRISKKAFVAALQYLVEHDHDHHEPCPVRSNSHPLRAGPLCRATRDANANVRCIDYILPILASRRIVHLDDGPPARTWLTHVFLHTEPHAPAP
ncbi:MAG: hypothetical protein KKD25_16405 [Gammaproteobacteria bacterium]|nr:hypothetical protein [Gammaproteobacteria bacterium]MBU0771192.1 hypothetical protein [Gammaproteobacteria bacterium]MBU0855920.1 hypothetical protein [Gammaproteobacteria bacterium]MBU1848995.1 hypothetical protein [Gammaproteobacteria bacterium]